MKPRNLTVSSICKAIAREHSMKVEDISSQVSFLLISTHNTNELNKLNAIYESYRYSKPTRNGFSTVKSSGKPYSMDDRINYINGFIDINDALSGKEVDNKFAKKVMEVLAIGIKDELLSKYGRDAYKNPSLKYITGLHDGYKVYKKSK